MAFRFKIEVLLRLRVSVEHQQELLLRAVNLEVIQMRERIESLEDWAKRLNEQERLWMSSGISGSELHFDAVIQEAVARRRGELMRQLTTLERVRARRREEYEEARRQRELAESVRDHQLRAYRQLQARHEQRGLDDLHLIISGAKPR